MFRYGSNQNHLAVTKFGKGHTPQSSFNTGAKFGPPKFVVRYKNLFMLLCNLS